MRLFEIEDVNFLGLVKYGKIEIDSGRVYFIVGKSGSGKSTLLKLLNATATGDVMGKLSYEGKSILDTDTIALRREVMLCGQNVFLIDGSVKDNFKYFYELREKDEPSDEEITKYLSICCASEKLNEECRNFSGGEKQRVYIAIFLSFLPKVLLLDEPTSALDEATSDKLLTNLIEFCKNQGITLVCVSHNTKMANKHADEIIDLGFAKIEESSNCKERESQESL